jgi:hypothetical protein
MWIATHRICHVDGKSYPVMAIISDDVVWLYDYEEYTEQLQREELGKLPTIPRWYWRLNLYTRSGFILPDFWVEPIGDWHIPERVYSSVSPWRALRNVAIAVGMLCVIEGITWIMAPPPATERERDTIRMMLWCSSTAVAAATIYFMWQPKAPRVPYLGGARKSTNNELDQDTI